MRGRPRALRLLHVHAISLIDLLPDTHPLALAGGLQLVDGLLLVGGPEVAGGAADRILLPRDGVLAVSAAVELARGLSVGPVGAGAPAADPPCTDAVALVAATAPAAPPAQA